MYGSARFTCGHRGNNARVKVRASMARAISGPALRPGSGTKMNAPLTRASTSTKPKIAGNESVS